jgi:hypothetical protein
LLSFAFGKSCLLARMRRGVPWLSGHFAVRISWKEGRLELKDEGNKTVSRRYRS